MLITNILTEFDAIAATGERVGPAVLALLNEQLGRADDTLCLHGEFEIPENGGTVNVQIDQLVGDGACALVLSGGFGADRGIVFASLADTEWALVKLRPLFEPVPEPVATPRHNRPVVIVTNTAPATVSGDADLVRLFPSLVVPTAAMLHYFEFWRDRPDVVAQIEEIVRAAALSPSEAALLAERRAALADGSAADNVRMLWAERRALVRLIDRDEALPDADQVLTGEDGVNADELADKLLWQPIGANDETGEPILMNVDTYELSHL